MAIIHITGPKKSGKSLLANSIRNTHIGQSAVAEGRINGALLVDDTQTGEPRYLLEKLMLGESLGKPGVGEPVPKPAESIAWKSDATTIFVGDKIEMLADFEALAPGFTAKFGPVRTISLGDA
jgi:hypothetical protein